MKFSIVVLLLVVSNFAMALERDVSFTSEGIVLRGKIATPDSSEGKVPGIVLVHGLGYASSDMDMTVPASQTADGKPTKTFKVISDFMVKRGYAVMRYNKRGVQVTDDGSVLPETWGLTLTSFSTLKSDLQTAINIFKKDPKVNEKKIILIGFDEGSVVSAMVGNDDLGVAAIIGMGAIGRSIDDLLYYQNVEYHSGMLSKHLDVNNDGFIDAKEAVRIPEMEMPIDKVDLDGDKRASKIEVHSMLMSIHISEKEAIRDDLRSAWYKDAIKHGDLYSYFVDFAESRGRIHLMHGEEDGNVPVSDSYLIYSKVVRKVKKASISLQSYRGLGSGFSPNTGTEKVMSTFGPIDNKVLRDLFSWIYKRYPSKK